MWQVLLLLNEQSHLIAGLLLLLSNSVSFIADPLHGSPLMFHKGVACVPHRWNIEFRALTVSLSIIKYQLRCHLFNIQSKSKNKTNIYIYKKKTITHNCKDLGPKLLSRHNWKSLTWTFWVKYLIQLHTKNLCTSICCKNVW